MQYWKYHAVNLMGYHVEVNDLSMEVAEALGAEGGKFAQKIVDLLNDEWDIHTVIPAVNCTTVILRKAQ